MAAARARDEAREARKQKRSTRLSRAETVPHPDDRASTGSEAREAADPAAAILDAVTRYPGLTCERIAEIVQSPTVLVKPHLAALTVGGRLRKVGRARGTRYHLA